MRYVLGLDIGIASIGWAIRNLDKDRIEDLGVRIFEKGEADKGKPINAQRRESRSARRTLRRKAMRMLKVRELLVKYGLVNLEDLKSLYIKHPNEMSPWKLRYEALNRVLSGEEMAIVLTHLAKRRGFKSNSKVNKDIDEAGKVTKAIDENRRYMKAQGYRTIGEMFFKDDRYKNHKRNKGKKIKEEGYLCSVSRDLIEDEIKKIFDRQRGLGSKLASEDFEKEYLSTVMFQLPFSNEELLLKMVGECTFERNEKRAPKHSFTAERFTLLDKVNNLTIYNRESGKRFLVKEEKEQIIALCYKKKEVKYTDIRKVLNLEPIDRFSTLTYSSKKNVEESKFISLKGYHEILGKLKNKALINNTELMDKIIEALTLIKDEDKLIVRFKGLGLDEEEARELAELNFSNFSNLSMKALKNVLPYLEEGKPYYEACNLAGYNFNNPRQLDKHRLLPKIDDDIKNPVVLRAITQSRKLINAVIRKHGSPTAVHIEVARDLAKSYEERIKIKRNQDERKSAKDRLSEQLKNEMHVENITSKAFEKYMLASEQDFKCVYSQEAIDVNRLLNDPTYCQIDHILPYSQSFDDSFNNKVVVLTRENQNKGNRIPYDYFKAIGREWSSYEAFIKGLTQLDKEKQNRLLKHSFTKEEMKDFKERNLNDTKYIARYLKNFIESRLVIEKEEGRRAVMVIPGRLTDTMRHRWGLKKDRDKDHLHHAMDACIIACIDEKLVKRIAEYSMNCEVQFVKGEVINPETGEVINKTDQNLIRERFPMPWKSFREEVLARLSSNPVAEIQKIGNNYYDDALINDLEPILISKMAKTKLKGQLHDATIKRVTDATLGRIQVTMPLNKLTLEDIDNMCDKEKKPELYAALREKLISHKGDAAKAFEEPLKYLPSGKKKEVSVEEIKIYRAPINKFFIRNGIAEIGQCIRVDVFRKQDSYYFRNVYGIDILKGKLSEIAKGGSYVYLTDEYEFCFSLYKDNLISINYDGQKKLGYFEYFESDGRVNITSTISEEKIGRISLGKISEIKKYDVDLLGEKKEIKKEAMNNNYKKKKRDKRRERKIV
ncbi:type II CRISPR RNA-guided endonuclease Cas9 [Clostridium thermarum]|uniref:type II CRISPR RNA-guided endonuclease Cas9 n=1 Tax=Clostridium thermarum TaxID=1716543 RepID=UPI0013D32401|nr:type II CRISPR RNA-guided endonuclease Cas9 [Clostridium thermarum]